MNNFIPYSTIYVSLEPCAHWGKTPPCADLIVAKQIPRVVVGCRDPFDAVNGKGIEKLRLAGRDVTVDVCAEECRQLNRRFFLFHTQQRPYIILKWAQTGDGKMAFQKEERLYISNHFTNRKVHHWRSEEAAILVGTHTALLDNPALTNRLWTGRSPVRMVLDRQLRLPASLHLFDKEVRTVILNEKEHTDDGHLVYYKLAEGEEIASAICRTCKDLNLTSLIVEGGRQLLQTFIDAGLWDEARIITNPALYIGEGLLAPILHHHQPSHSEMTGSDRIDYFFYIPS